MNRVGTIDIFSVTEININYYEKKILNSGILGMFTFMSPNVSAAEEDCETLTLICDDESKNPISLYYAFTYNLYCIILQSFVVRTTT